MTIANLEKALKIEDLDDDQRRELEGLIGRKAGKPSLKVAAKNPID
jgi:hypothetical protein